MRVKISELAQALINMNDLTKTMSEKLVEFYKAYNEVRDKQIELTDLMIEVLKETK